MKKLKLSSSAHILAMILISVQICLYAFMWLRLLNDPSLKTMDFISFYAAGRLMRMGEYQQVYNLEAQALIQNEVIGEASAPLIFAHPPHLNFLLAAIAGEDYVSAYILWSALNLIILLFCMELIRRFLL